MKTIFGIDDDLQSFAEGWLSGDIVSNDSSIAYADGAAVVRLYRDKKFQVELCCVPPGFVIPDHTHPHADTIELTVAGLLRLHVNGADIYAGLDERKAKRFGRGKGVRINKTDTHGTIEPVGKNGALFLSIQRWDSKPMSVLTDYCGAPLGSVHQEMLNERR